MLCNKSVCDTYLYLTLDAIIDLLNYFEWKNYVLLLLIYIIA
jgi:hypothetical protein